MPSSRLSRGQRDTEILHLHNRGHTQGEIAVALGVSQTTVGRRLQALSIPAHPPGRPEARRATIQAYNAAVRNHHKEQHGLIGKTCRKCHQWRPLDQFSTSANTWDGYENRCNACNRQRRREQYQHNKDEINARRRTPEYRAKMRSWYREYERNKLANDLEFRLKRRLRHAVYRALKGLRKETPTMTLLGCSLEELRAHLEGQFIDGMTWDNYGKGGWELDHIKPIASFDITNQSELEECFHYTNLQPLWGPANWSKGAKI